MIRRDTLGRRIMPHFYDLMDSWTRHGRIGDWANQAACRNHNPELWFPPETGRGRWPRNNPNTNHAKTICASCPVKTECLIHALNTHETGIWGATTDLERDELRRRQERFNS